MNNAIQSDHTAHYGHVPANGGGPWFVLSDVCRAIGSADLRDFSSRLEQYETGTVITRTADGHRQMAVVSEAGLLRLAQIGTTAEAARLRVWMKGAGRLSPGKDGTDQPLQRPRKSRTKERQQPPSLPLLDYINNGHAWELVGT